MSDRYKFRGKRVDNGEWVSGFYFSCESYGTFIIPAECRKCDVCSSASHCDAGWIEVHPDTVGQYTGLKDKNGVEIYCGSRVRHNNNVRPAGEFEVEWDMYKAGWSLTGLGKDEEFWLRDWSPDFIEVIGTIHDKEQSK